ncbi:MAG: hypothetical protein ABIG08_00140 [bacterium]
MQAKTKIGIITGSIFMVIAIVAIALDSESRAVPLTPSTIAAFAAFVAVWTTVGAVLGVLFVSFLPKTR